MGSIRKQGIANTIISYIGICIGFLNLFILQPLMLTSEEFGLTRILYSCTLIIGSVFPAGLNLLTIKFFPRFRNKENGHNGYLGILLLLALIGYLIAGVIIFASKDYFVSKYSSSPLFVEYFYFIFPISFCVGFTSVITGYCSALFKTSVPSFLNDIYLRVFMMIIVALYFLKLVTFNQFVALYCLSYVIQLLALIYYLKFLKAFNFKINWVFFKTQNLSEIFKYTFFLALATVASIGIRNIDVMLIGSYLDLNAVAVYALGMTIGTLIEMPVNALGRITDSKISDAIQRDDMNMIKEVYHKSVKYLIIIGGILFVLLFSNVDEALSFLPEKYHGAKWVILIISFSALINMATGPNTSIIYYSNKYVIGSYLLFAMILISVILNIILIPIYGIEGSATATAIAMILYNVAKFFLIKKHFHLQPYDIKVFKILLCILICFGISLILPTFNNILLLIATRCVILTGIFVASLLVFKVFSLEEIKNIKNLS